VDWTCLAVSALASRLVKRARSESGPNAPWEGGRAHPGGEPLALDGALCRLALHNPCAPSGAIPCGGRIFMMRGFATLSAVVVLFLAGTYALERAAAVGSD
jgi:hypothetical protein